MGGGTRIVILLRPNTARQTIYTYTCGVYRKRVSRVGWFVHVNRGTNKLPVYFIFIFFLLLLLLLLRPFAAWVLGRFALDSLSYSPSGGPGVFLAAWTRACGAVSDQCVAKVFRPRRTLLSLSLSLVCVSMCLLCRLFVCFSVFFPPCELCACELLSVPILSSFLSTVMLLRTWVGYLYVSPSSACDIIHRRGQATLLQPCSWIPRTTCSFQVWKTTRNSKQNIKRDNSR